MPAEIWHSIHYEQIAYDPFPLLQDIMAPTFILRGEEDLIATAAHQAQLQSAIVGSASASLPGCGHNMHWENPEAVAGLLRAFLQKS